MTNKYKGMLSKIFELINSNAVNYCLLFYLVCVNFKREWRHLQFNVDSKRQIFEKLWRFYLILEYLTAICWEEVAKRNNFIFHILFWCLTWDTNSGFMSNKPTLYLLDYGDFSFNSPNPTNYLRLAVMFVCLYVCMYACLWFLCT